MKQLIFLISILALPFFFLSSEEVPTLHGCEMICTKHFDQRCDVYRINCINKGRERSRALKDITHHIGNAVTIQQQNDLKRFERVIRACNL